MYIAYFGEPNLKRACVARAHHHRQLDQIIHGKYWEDGKGCAIGCVLHSSEHAAIERQLGFPTALAFLFEWVFESRALPPDEETRWPVRCFAAPRVGADLSLVVPQMMRWLFDDPEHGLLARNLGAAQQTCERAAVVVRRAAAGETVPTDEIEAARLAARAALAALTKLGGEQ